jgi:predicted membrane protein
MPKSKARKNHKQKVNARKIATANEKSRVQNSQKEFIKDLIKQEQEKGLFDNNATIEPVLNGSIDTTLAGPSF